MADDSYELCIRSLDEEMANFDKVVDRTDVAKDNLVTMTSHVLGNINLNDVKLEDPKSIDSFTKLASVALKAVDSKEATAKGRIAAKLKLQESRRSDGASEIVAQLYKQMQDGTYTPSVEGVTLETDGAEVDARFAHDNLPPIEEWETRMDPNDLS